jgi:lysophospholipase L1-like esterase
MARRSSRAATTGALATVAAAGFLIAFAVLAHAQPAAAPGVDSGTSAGTALSKSCQPGAAALAENPPLPSVAAALAKRKTLRVLAMGAAPGRVGRHGATYTALIKEMLSRALNGVPVEVINRGVSGELASNAAQRMRNEVGLEEPDLVLWQVGTNDALAYVPTAEFIAAVAEQIEWLKAHKIDVVLVGLQFTPQAMRDEHYVEVREALRKLAAEKGVLVLRFYEAMQILNAATEADLPLTREFDLNDDGYNCLAQYVVRAITLGVFGAHLAPRPKPPQ